MDETPGRRHLPLRLNVGNRTPFFIPPSHVCKAATAEAGHSGPVSGWPSWTCPPPKKKGSRRRRRSEFRKPISRIPTEPVRAWLPVANRRWNNVADVTHYAVHSLMVPWRELVAAETRDHGDYLPANDAAQCGTPGRFPPSSTDSSAQIESALQMQDAEVVVRW